MSFKGLYLRSLPIVYTFAAVLVAVFAPGIDLEAMPGLDNVAFVITGAFLTGLIPLCILLGFAFMAVDFLYPPKRNYYIAISLVVMLAILVWGYNVGQNLDF